MDGFETSEAESPNDIQNDDLKGFIHTPWQVKMASRVGRVWPKEHLKGALKELVSDALVAI